MTCHVNLDTKHSWFVNFAKEHKIRKKSVSVGHELTNLHAPLQFVIHNLDSILAFGPYRIGYHCFVDFLQHQRRWHHEIPSKVLKKMEKWKWIAQKIYSVCSDAHVISFSNLALSFLVAMFSIKMFGHMIIKLKSKLIWS